MADRRASKAKRRHVQWERFNAEPAYPPTTHKRRPLRPERLHAASRILLDYLSAHRPQWLGAAWNVLGYTHKQFDLEAEIAPPRGYASRLRLPPMPIVIWMNHGVEPSVTWGDWHAHAFFADSLDDLPTPEHLERIVSLVDDILADRTTVVSGRSRATAGRRSGAAAAAAGVIKLDSDGARPTDVIERSWSGRLDRRIRVRRGRRGSSARR